MRLSVALLLAMSLTTACAAQDRRTVVEPTIPPVCTTLRAALTAEAHQLKEADEEKLDTTRLQGALDACGRGKAVELTGASGHSAFLSGPLTIPEGTTLLIDRGVTLYGSRDPKVYEVKPGSCGLVNSEPAGCKPLIGINHAPHAAIMGDGAIDGRGGAKLLHGEVSWWDLANQARAGGRQQVPRLIVADHSDDFTLYRITLHNSANFHVVYHDGKGFTVWGLKIDTPRNARNTDGVDPGASSDITVTKSYIRTGDDNIAIKGSGTGVQHMSVVDNHFYYGHGMSIGSETFAGVSDLLVRDLTLEGTDSGIRIKSNVSRGGLVQHAVYENVCIRDNKAPISIDTAYNNPGPRQDLVPEYRDIELHNVQVSGGGKVVVQGQDEKHRTLIRLDGVLLDNPGAYKFSAAHAVIQSGPGPVNFSLAGPDVENDGRPGSGHLPSCDGRFVPFPAVP